MFLIWLIGLLTTVSGTNTTHSSQSQTFSRLIAHASLTKVKYSLASALESTGSFHQNKTLPNKAVITAEISKREPLLTIDSASSQGNIAKPIEKTKLSLEKRETKISLIMTARVSLLLTTAIKAIQKTSITPTPSSSYWLEFIGTKSEEAFVSSPLNKGICPSKTLPRKQVTVTKHADIFGINGEYTEYIVPGALAVAGICLILLITVCCCFANKMKKFKRTMVNQADATVTENRGAEDRKQATAFPSPVQLKTFSVRGSEPAYENPHQEENEVSYITVIDDNVPQYINAKSINNTNEVTEPQPHSPVYYNTNLFSDSPYQELKTVEREKEPQYTSLVQNDV